MASRTRRSRVAFVFAAAIHAMYPDVAVHVGDAENPLAGAY